MDDPTKGQELEVEIAERIFGWQRVQPVDQTYTYGGRSWSGYLLLPPRREINDHWRLADAETARSEDFWEMLADEKLPRYAESLDAAWFIVQEMRKRGHTFVFTAAAHDLWYCSFAPPPCNPSSSVRDEMAAAAICKAALKAIS